MANPPELTNAHLVGVMGALQSPAPWNLTCLSEAATAIEELIRRRNEENSPERIRERSIAYSAACQLIEGCCGQVEDADGHEPWFDLEDWAEFSADDVYEAACYLDGRGLLERHPTKPNIVRLIDEDEGVPNG